jgi:ribosome-binding protein aMBF1 (putative translation factor)
MNAPIEVQIIHHDGVPAFAVLPMAQYESLLLRQGEKRATFPHDVVKLNVQQGYSLLKAWRRWLGWSQSELARKAGITQAQVARFESGKGTPRADTLLRLSNAMGVMADLLWEIDEDDGD